MRGEGCGEEAARRGDIPALGDEYLDDLAVLVHGPIDVPPHSGDLDVGLVDEPPVTHMVPARACRVDQFGGEVLDPPVQRDVVHVDAALGEKRNPGNADGTSTHCLNPRLGFIRPRSPSSRDPSMQHRLRDGWLIPVTTTRSSPAAFAES